jgi:hypothetical protein
MTSLGGVVSFVVSFEGPVLVVISLSAGEALEGSLGESLEGGGEETGGVTMTSGTTAAGCGAGSFSEGGSASGRGKGKDSAARVRRVRVFTSGCGSSCAFSDVESSGVRVLLVRPEVSEAGSFAVFLVFSSGAFVSSASATTAAFVRLLGADSVSFAFAILTLSPLTTFIGAHPTPNGGLPPLWDHDYVNLNRKFQCKFELVNFKLVNFEAKIEEMFRIVQNTYRIWPSG